MKKLLTFLATAAALFSGCGARSMLHSPDPETPAVAYVTNRSTGTVSVIDTGRHRVTATIRVGNDPLAIALSADRHFAYVVNRCGDDPECQSYGTVSAVDLERNAAVATIGLQYADATCQPVSIAISTKSGVAYVTNQCKGSLQPGLISVIDTARNEVVASIASPSAPQDAAVSADGRFAYIAHVSAGISAIDTESSTVSATISDVATGGGMTISRDGRFIYVASGCPSSERRCSFSGLTVVDAATNTVAATIPLSGAPSGVTTSADGRFVYVMNTAEPLEDAVAVIETSTNAVRGSIRIGEAFCRIAVGTDNRFAYATNCHAGRVVVIDTVANSIAASLPIDGTPCGIAVGAP